MVRGFRVSAGMKPPYGAGSSPIAASTPPLCLSSSESLNQWKLSMSGRTTGHKVYLGIESLDSLSVLESRA